MILVRLALAAAHLLAVDGARMRVAKSGSEASCGRKGSTSRNGTHTQIVNGERATECEWKWQAGLTSGSNGWENVPFCGGMLISEDWVLTAAHCADKPDFDVVLGEYKVGSSSGYEQVRAAVEVIQHPKYNGRTSSGWDLCMVRLASPVQMSSCVGTVCLPRKGDVEPGTKCWISGWGTLRKGGEQPDILMEAEVKVMSNDECMEENDYDSGDITQSMICAQGRSNGKTTDACQGDSGGPLVCESSGVWTVYGATSWGKGCAKEYYPGVWARVHEGMSWIDGILSGNQGPSPFPSPSPTRRRRRRRRN